MAKSGEQGIEPWPGTAIGLHQFFGIRQVEQVDGINDEPHFLLVGASTLPRQYLEVLPGGI